jgi:hypothetical protein
MSLDPNDELVGLRRSGATCYVATTKSDDSPRAAAVRRRTAATIATAVAKLRRSRVRSRRRTTLVGA